MQQKPLLSKPSKIIICIALGIYGLFMVLLHDQQVAGWFSFLRFLNPSTPVPMSSISPSTVASPSPKPEGEFSNSSFSPKGDYFVTLDSVRQDDNTYLITLSGYGWGERRYMEPNGLQRTMWENNVDEVTAKAYKYGNYVTWSSSGYKLALLTLSNVVEVWQFEEEVVSKVEKGLKVTTHESYQLPDAGYTLLFFDKNQIYLENHEKMELYTLLPELKRITGLEKVYGKQHDGASLSPTLFALPTNDGIGFGGDTTISFWRNGRITSYPLDASDLADGYFQAIISPNLDRICVVAQSSGYRGYSVFRLEGGRFRRATARGMQYSDCKEWVDNNHVVVEENAYPSQYLYQYFLLDVQTGEKTFLSRYNSSEL